MELLGQGKKTLPRLLPSGGTFNERGHRQLDPGSCLSGLWYWVLHVQRGDEEWNGNV